MGRPATTLIVKLSLGRQKKLVQTLIIFNGLKKYFESSKHIGLHLSWVTVNLRVFDSVESFFSWILHSSQFSTIKPSWPSWVTHKNFTALNEKSFIYDDVDAKSRQQGKSDNTHNIDWWDFQLNIMKTKGGGKKIFSFWDLFPIFPVALM